MSALLGVQFPHHGSRAMSRFDLRCGNPRKSAGFAGYPAETARGPEAYDNVVIPAHTLYGDYPPKIAEAEIKPLSQSGEIVLSRVVIPEFIVVHDGAPTDSTAGDYYVRYRDYIKNVASSEIYATWPKAPSVPMCWRSCRLP